MDVETGDATDQPEDVPERPRIRVRPADFIVPPDDPFKNDLLMRREPIEVLTHLLKSIEGPCTLAIDSPWGTGKTSFIEMWSAYLRREGFTVAAFNAWETDFAGEPFAALTAELTEALDPGPNSALAKTIKSTKDAALKVLKHAVPGAIRVATAGILDLSPLLEEEIAEALANSAEESLQKYHDGKDSITDFRAKLAELASCVAEETEGLPLVIIADELDRCRPLYAVELLESAKHLLLCGWCDLRLRG